MSTHSSLAVAGSPPSLAAMVRSGLGFAALLGFAAAPFWPAVQNLVTSTWQETDHAHGPIVAVVALALFSARGTSIQLRRLPEPAGLVLLLGALGVGLLARFAYVDVVQHLAVIAVAWLAFATIAGWRVAVRLWFPFAFLVFAVPVLEGLIPSLQRATVAVVEGGVASIGIPAVISGSTVSVPAGSFEIERGCAGLHFFVVALAGSLLYAYVYRLRPRAALPVIMLGGALGIVINWIRVLVIVWRGQATDMQSSLISSGHLWFGWTLFAIATLVFFGVMQASGVHRYARAALTKTTTHNAVRPAGWAALMVASILVVSAAYATAREASRGNIAAEPMPLVAAAGWKGPAAAPAVWRVGFKDPAAEVYAAYTRGAEFVEYYTAAYALQGPGRKLIGYGSSIAGPGWLVVSHDTASSGLRHPGDVLSAHIRSPRGELWLVRYWYQVGYRVTTSRLAVKWLEGRQVVGRLAPSGVVAVASPCAETCDAAARAIDGFMRDHALALVPGLSNETALMSVPSIGRPESGEIGYTE